LSCCLTKKLLLSNQGKISDHNLQDTWLEVSFMIIPSMHKGDIALQIHISIKLLIVVRRLFNNRQTKSETYNGTKLFQEILYNGKYDIKSNLKIIS